MAERKGSGGGEREEEIYRWGEGKRSSGEERNRDLVLRKGKKSWKGGQRIQQMGRGIRCTGKGSGGAIWKSAHFALSVWIEKRGVQYA